MNTHRIHGLGRPLALGLGVIRPRTAPHVAASAYGIDLHRLEVIPVIVLLSPSATIRAINNVRGQAWKIAALDGCGHVAARKLLIGTRVAPTCRTGADLCAWIAESAPLGPNHLLPALLARLGDEHDLGSLALGGASGTKHIGPKQLKELAPSLWNACSLPLANAWLLNLAEPRNGSGPTQSFNDRFIVHARIVGIPTDGVNRHSYGGLA